jgi:hypothetical protein
MEILRRTGQGQVLGLDHAMAYGWPNTASPRPARERLACLERAGYLASHRVDGRVRDELVFTLTPKGARLFSQYERKQLTQGLPDSRELKQQLWAQSARLKLETQLAARGARIIGWLNERHLRGQAQYRHLAEARTMSGKLNSDQIADARATVLEADDSVHEIEIEICGDYYGKRLAHKVIGLDRVNRQIGRPVLWVVTLSQFNRVNNEISRAGATNSTILLIP